MPLFRSFIRSSDAPEVFKPSIFITSVRPKTSPSGNASRSFRMFSTVFGKNSAIMSGFAAPMSGFVLPMSGFSVSMSGFIAQCPVFALQIKATTQLFDKSDSRDSKDTGLRIPVLFPLPRATRYKWSYCQNNPRSRFQIPHSHIHL